MRLAEQSGCLTVIEAAERVTTEDLVLWTAYWELRAELEKEAVERARAEAEKKR